MTSQKVQQFSVMLCKQLYKYSFKDNGDKVNEVDKFMVYCTKLHHFLLTLEKHMLALKIKKYSGNKPVHGEY